MGSCDRTNSARAFLEVQQVPLPQKALAKGAAPLCEQFGHLFGGFRTCPVALQFGPIGLGRDRARARLHHPLHRHVMGFARRTAAGVCDDIHLIARVERG
jgi:hypothetical protein